MAIGLIGFLLFTVFSDAVSNPVVRIVLIVTAGVMVFVYMVDAAIKRNRRERELLDSRHLPPHGPD